MVIMTIIMTPLRIEPDKNSNPCSFIHLHRYINSSETFLKKNNLNGYFCVVVTYVLHSPVSVCEENL